MPRSTPVDDFCLAYSEHGEPSAQTVVLLHGWPGDSHDFRLVVPLLEDRFRVVVPDLRGFGESDRHLLDPDTFYTPSAQARSIASLIDELQLIRPIVGGYDIGSRVAQTLAKEYPTSVGALAVSPPLPGAGHRVLDGKVIPELWYQYFHRSPLSVQLLDGQRANIRAYLHHFWRHWSGPDFVVDTPEFEQLVDRYSRPGAFESASNWYRVGAGYIANALNEQPPQAPDRLSLPVHVLWQELDPIFPRSWSDGLDVFFSDATLHKVDGIGHFTPLEAPRGFADIVIAAARATQ
jgi:pimeloyl-ACP methyl ester carboxylesterase